MIDPSELKIEALGRQGHGGQYVTMTLPGVRVTHLPTGIMVQVIEGRSQHINRQIAIEMIEYALTHPRHGK